MRSLCENVAPSDKSLKPYGVLLFAKQLSGIVTSTSEALAKSDVTMIEAILFIIKNDFNPTAPNLNPI